MLITRERERVASNADIQKQIQQLKQENELLELQQKNEALKRGETSAEIKEQIDAIKSENERLKAKKAENNKIIKSGFLGFCRGKYEASGCFIGGEIGLAITDNWFWFNEGNLHSISNETLSPNKTTLNVPINLIFGYQWYYMQNQGLKVKANIGYTNYNVDFNIKYKSNGGSGEESQKYKFNNNALQYGLELAWLWDFLRKGKHTLGIDLGAGFEASTFFNNSKIEGHSVNVNDTKFAFNFRTGLHYYLNVNHQIGLAYSYKTYTTINGVGIKLKENNNNNVELGKLATSPRNQILLSYAYKF